MNPERFDTEASPEEEKIITEQVMRVPEKEFKSKIEGDLENISLKPGDAAIVMLARKLKSFKDSMDESPVFIFGHDSENEAKEIMGDWINSIDSEHFFLPGLNVNYLISLMKEKDLNSFLEDVTKIPPENGDTKIAINKYKEALAASSE